MTRQPSLPSDSRWCCGRRFNSFAPGADEDQDLGRKDTLTSGRMALKSPKKKYALMQTLLSFAQAGPGKRVRQEQEEIFRNHRHPLPFHRLGALGFEGVQSADGYVRYAPRRVRLPAALLVDRRTEGTRHVPEAEGVSDQMRWRRRRQPVKSPPLSANHRTPKIENGRKTEGENRGEFSVPHSGRNYTGEREADKREKTHA